MRCRAFRVCPYVLFSVFMFSHISSSLLPLSNANFVIFQCTHCLIMHVNTEHLYFTSRSGSSHCFALHFYMEILSTFFLWWMLVMLSTIFVLIWYIIVVVFNTNIQSLGIIGFHYIYIFCSTMHAFLPAPFFPAFPWFITCYMGTRGAPGLLTLIGWSARVIPLSLLCPLTHVLTLRVTRPFLATPCVLGIEVSFLAP